ncbi:LamG domain-containing protein [Variovorax sp. PAMC26660]|uniref:LamG domain-containing protein n=1 Tax=Variovorax sp. PAMC26660 TaxID=2762322 RepID=UPI0021C3025F|nr:LamG domain-containing protein [Variovorax sp. PAMC26660]
MTKAVSMQQQQQPLPPHRSLHVPGVHGYTDRKSVAAGEVVRFHVSSDVPYTLSVCQLGPDVEERSADTVLHAFAPSAPRVQPIHPGSYVRVERGLDQPLRSVTLECWVQPWSVGTRQSVMGQYDLPGACGYGLFIDEAGRAVFYLGDGGAFRADGELAGGALVPRRWHHIVATWDGRATVLWLDGVVVARGTWTGPLQPGCAPLRLGSSGVDGLADAFLEGDLVMPAIYAHALQAGEVRERFADRGLHTARGRGVLACWPLREERGDVVADASGHQRTGRIVNHGTWMIVGPAFEPHRVDEFSDNGYDPLADPTRGHGLRLASDDLYDCRWPESHAFRIPASAKSGVYVGRVRFMLDGQAADYDISFIVRRAAHQAPAPVLVLCATNSWLAYASTPFARNGVADPVWPRRSAGLENSHPDAPAYSSYTYHRGGQPTYQVGLRMPWPNASPNALYDPADAGFCQWTRLERRLHVWLDQAGYAFDVVSDLDLHRDPGLLKAYKTVVINGHSEYWSLPACDGLDHYLSGGGTAIVLSGNTMYLRVSYNEDGTVMEQRKVLGPNDKDSEEAAKVRPPAGPFGEQYHSQDWARGGQFRQAGRSCAELIGLESAGWAFADGDDFGVYHATLPRHFLFSQPHALNLREGSTFGHAPGGGLPRAIGHEWDLSVATLRRMTHALPSGQCLPEAQRGIEVIAQGRRPKPGRLDAYLDYFSNVTESLDGLSAEMIYWERPQGGRVFNAGAVGASWVLGVDPCFEGVLRNVLHHFGVSPVAGQPVHPPLEHAAP